MTMKKLISALIAALMIVTLSGCRSPQSDVDTLLQPPKLEGDMAPVQQALEDAVGDDITLKYPTTGDYRSAFILKDLNGDTRREAIALYSVTADSTVSMHINVISSDGENWESKGDLSLVGSGVESVSFSDLDGDGNLEIIVGWTVYSTVEKQVGIYAYDGTLKQRAIEPYTNFLCADISGDGISDLSVVHLNLSAKTASARVFSLSNAGITEVGMTPLDGGVSSYSAPILSTLSTGTPALYIDGMKGSGMLTEIVWFEEGALKSLYDPQAPETSLTYRPSTVSSRDYNSDGVIDLPLSELLMSTADFAEVDKVYFTNWSEFDGKNFSVLASTFMNYSDGYSLTVPEKWKNSLLLIRMTEARMRFLYSFNPETKASGDELFRLVVATTADIEAGTYPENEYIQLDKVGNLTYLAKVSENNSLGITQEDVRQMFSIIK